MTEKTMVDKLWKSAVAAASHAPTTGSVVLESSTILEIDALLSKLRAEGVQAGDERAALQKLVKLEDMRLRLRALHESGHGTDYDAYRKALPAAWEAARAALASAPVAITELRIEFTAGGVGYVSIESARAAVLAASKASAPVAGEAYQGDSVAERLDNMADDQHPGSQAQSDLYAAATLWRKHIAHRTAPQASEAVRWIVTDDMRAAVRFAPSSAHWSERLKEFFGPDAREGINALEKQLREARADLDRQQHASEAVRTEALYLLREARALLPLFATAEAIGDWSEKVNRFAAGDVIDIPPQADKDGGDCVKGAGDAMAIHPEIQAVLAMLDVPVLGYLGSHSGKLIKSSDKVDSFESAVPLVSETAHRAACEKIIAALSPAPSVVKQSLTATQTGEKGEKDAG